MARKGSIFLRFVIVFMSTCCGFEIDMLLSMKASINEQYSQHLRNWNASVSVCKWNGITCSDSSHVSRIDLPGKNLSGRISKSIFRLPYIQFIDLSGNQLFGEIPRNLSSLALKYLNLSNNNLTGLIPSNHFPVLETLDLSNNMLSGAIPGGIGLLSGLKVLDFGGNVLSGQVPESIANLTMLEFLTLASNQFSCEIPRELGELKALKWIYLGHNNFSGGIPWEIGELTALNHLDLVANNLTGEIPSSLGNLTNLIDLFLYSNNLTGPIPKSLFNLKKLVSLDLSCNSLYGEIPALISQLQELEVLHLFSNNFSGKIPYHLSSLPLLQVLQLWSNRFSGEIPRDLGKHNNLTILDLSSNNLTGKIPESLCSSRRLSKLILFSNSLEGKIPGSLSHCKSLQRVRVQGNRLSGELSPEFTALPLVYYLDVSSNNLAGRIDNREWNIPQLQMLNLARNELFGTLPASFGSNKLESLDLSGNNFTGSIPGKFGQFLELMELKLSQNELSGRIPDQLSDCKKLVIIDLSHNRLTGEIPSSLAALPVLGQLDLSVNELTGNIPSTLGEVDSLLQVNVSYNRFHGRLPATGAFLAINASAVVGNKLCSGQKTSVLPRCNDAKGHVRWFVLTFLLACLMTFSVVFFLAVFIRKWNPRFELKRVETEDGIWEMQFLNSRISRSLTIEDILSSIREENLVASGGTGPSYKGKFKSGSNRPFLAKEVASVPESHWMEWTHLCEINHPNVVKLLAVCRSEKMGILVFEFVEGKDLSEVVRGLSWERRLKVILGVARALRYFHCRCSPSVTAVDITPRKILVDGKDEAHVRFRLPGTVHDPRSDKGLNSPYVAPAETQAGSKKDLADEKSNVYGFGVLLIELLTGKSRGDGEVAEMGIHRSCKRSLSHIGRSIVEWARYCYSDCHLEMWVDVVMKRKGDDELQQIVETMNLALRCTATDPEARPRAAHLLELLESIGRSCSCRCNCNMECC